MEIFDAAAIQGAVRLDSGVITLMQRAFAAQRDRETVMPPVAQILVERHANQTCVKGAYLPFLDAIGLKVAASYRPGGDCTRRNGFMMVLDGSSSALQAILLDDGYLTALRTAAAGGLCARLLARKTIRKLAVLGAGLQAELQIRAALLERQPGAISIWSRESERAERLCEALRGTPGAPDATAPVSTVRDAVEGADLIITATRACEPLILSDWVAPGAHITAMGSDAPGKSELAPDLLARCDLYAPDNEAQCAQIGELAAAFAHGVARSSIPLRSLADICDGVAEGRKRDEDVTIADLTGLGVQDAAIAHYAFVQLTKRGESCEAGNARGAKRA